MVAAAGPAIQLAQSITLRPANRLSVIAPVLCHRRPGAGQPRSPGVAPTPAARSRGGRDRLERSAARRRRLSRPPWGPRPRKPAPCACLPPVAGAPERDTGRALAILSTVPTDVAMLPRFGLA